MPAGASTNIWEASDTPPESWSDAEGKNEDDEWEYKGVVGEEVDSFGYSRYEIRWLGWERSNGTTSTWQHDDEDFRGIIRRWGRRQSRWRRETANQSLSIPVSTFTSMDIQDSATQLRAEAYDEKLELRRKTGFGAWKGWDEEIREHALFMDALVRRGEGKEEEGPRSLTLRRSTVRQSVLSTGSHGSAASTRAGASSRGRGSAKGSASSATPGASSSIVKSISTTFTRPPTGTPVVVKKSQSESQLRSVSPPRQAIPKNHQHGVPPTAAVSKLRRVQLLPSRSQSARGTQEPSRRAALQKEWTQEARRAGAAPVRIVNDIPGDEEEVPPVVDGFRYIEHAYEYDDDVPHAPDAECLVRCECTECTDAGNCACQQPSGVEDELQRKVWAYDEEGLFTFELAPGVEVIECNKYCACDDACPNRVAQRPRMVPVEIFKTEGCGWGVRATAAVERGQVIGVYTGKLVTREKAAGLAVWNYVFDLDSMEDKDCEDGVGRYSVDSHECGNWSRFLNHSCDPNMKVYSVVYETIPEMNTPYVAFVATKDIVARTELTFDYDPAAAKGKRKGRVPEGAKRCLCGAQNCRGWVMI